MHHKRCKPKSGRAGCLMCKPNKMASWPKHKALGHTGFSKIRRQAASLADLHETV